MKKALFFFLMVLLMLPSIMAIELEVKKQSSNEVWIYGLEKPVFFDLKITNLGESESISFYNLLGFGIEPSEKIFLDKNETKEIQLKIIPVSESNYRGLYTFEYFIKGQDSEIKETLTFRIINLEDSFEIGSGEVYPESNSIEIYVQNKVNFDFGEVSAQFSSPFFSFEKNFTLLANEKKSFEVQLNKEDFKKLLAGFYDMNAKISVENQKAEVKGATKFIEKDIVTSTIKDYGIIISTKIIKKTNEGNVLTKSETAIEKNVFSRLFTSFSPEPDNVERKGFVVYYTWGEEIKPGETFEIVVKTNWLFPFLVVIFIVVIVVLAKQYSKTNLVLKKRVSFVKTKGGEFALKVSVSINAKKYIERVNIIDCLPPLVKIYERFGGEHPSKINEKNRRIEWNFEKLETGEIRMVSYIIYSKIGILGKFALPSAKGIYEKDGEIHETESNRAFFVTEPRGKDFEEE